MVGLLWAKMLMCSAKLGFAVQNMCMCTQMVGLQEPPEGGHVVAKTIQVF